MRPVLVLRHGDDIPLGLLGDALAAASRSWVEVMLHDGDPIPPLDGFSGLVVLGGVMGAYDEEKHAWLADEKQLIMAAHEAGMPLLGICLGAQLCADVLGGRAYRGQPPAEIAFMALELTAAGVVDPVLREFDAPVVVFHQDTWDLPPGATLLARSHRFNHAFRLGSTLAIQAHPEADASIVEGWMVNPYEAPLLEAAGVDPVALLRQVRAGEAAQREMAARLFGAWTAEVIEAESQVSDARLGDVP